MYMHAHGTMQCASAAWQRQPRIISLSQGTDSTYCRNSDFAISLCTIGRRSLSQVTYK